MPKLRRLNGLEIVKILQQFGFEVIRIRGSHHILRRTVMIQDDEEIQTVNVPVHGSQPLALGMIKRIYRDLLQYMPEEELHEHFYSN